MVLVALLSCGVPAALPRGPLQQAGVRRTLCCCCSEAGTARGARAGQRPGSAVSPHLQRFVFQRVLLLKARAKAVSSCRELCIFVPAFDECSCWPFLMLCFNWQLQCC